jgi:hypothetical protein
VTDLAVDPGVARLRATREAVWDGDRPRPARPDDAPERLRRECYASLRRLSAAAYPETTSLPLDSAWRRDCALGSLGASAALLGEALQGRESPRGLLRRGLRPRHFREPLSLAFECMLGLDAEVADERRLGRELARRGLAGAEHLAGSLWFAAEGVTLDEETLAREDPRWLDGLERLRGYEEARLAVAWWRTCVVGLER